MWTEDETLDAEVLYLEQSKSLEEIAAILDKSTLQVLRKLVAMKVYVKKERPIAAMNKDMLGREIGKLLGIKLLTFGNMSRPELRKLLEHLEANID